MQQALWAWPTPPHKLPHPIPRAAEAPQAPQPPLALGGSPAAEQHLGLLLPRTQASSAAPARAQPFPRHRQPQNGNNVHWNSTYSGSLLHNNRHLTQGSPDFTDSKKGERGREDSAGKGSQRDGGDRARPALVTGVQNGPELQLQVRLNVFRADTISPLPTSCLVQLDPSSPKLTLSATEPPRATLGLERAGQPQQHQLAPSSCSPELLARGLKCFSSWSVLARHSGSVLPRHSLATLGPGTAHSPVTHGRRTHFSPPVCVSCPTPQCLPRLWKCQAEIPPLQAGMDSGRAQGESWLCVCGTGR